MCWYNATSVDTLFTIDNNMWTAMYDGSVMREGDGTWTRFNQKFQLSWSFNSVDVVVVIQETDNEVFILNMSNK